MLPGRRERQHAEMVAAIKAAALEQMATHGAASLSLNAIARALGVTTPALYRYVPNRDALITDLVLDAYHALDVEIEASERAEEGHALDARFLGLVWAYRRWVHAHAQDYLLIHGAAVPGFVLPLDLVLAAVQRPLRAVTAVFRDAAEAGRLRVPPAYRDATHGLSETLAPFVGDLPLPHLLLAYTLWLQVHALVWQEIQSPMPSVLLGEGTLFRVEMDLFAERIGLR